MSTIVTDKYNRSMTVLEPFRFPNLSSSFLLKETNQKFQTEKAAIKAANMHLSNVKSWLKTEQAL